ncbi:MAG: hypothetical protein LBT46_07235 [Planctomycetaceae bacterium]|jgi:hypothetical protein|nr:hypothetical protein [Planctomycetaceae bacterium]
MTEQLKAFYVKIESTNTDRTTGITKVLGWVDEPLPEVHTKPVNADIPVEIPSILVPGLWFNLFQQNIRKGNCPPQKLRPLVFRVLLLFERNQGVAGLDDLAYQIWGDDIRPDVVRKTVKESENSLQEYGINRFIEWNVKKELFEFG